MVYSLLYVSQSLLTASHENVEVQDILSRSRPRNLRLSVTGALVFTQARFAQVLEGPMPALDELMASIRRDRRHRDVEVVFLDNLPKRRFTDWSLAYSGPSIYIDRHIKPLLQPDTGELEKRDRALKLLDVISHLVIGTTGR